MGFMVISFKKEPSVHAGKPAPEIHHIWRSSEGTFVNGLGVVALVTALNAIELQK